MSVQETIAKGFEALGRESFQEAAQYARAGLAAAPGDPGALTLLGRLALAASRPDVALEIFEGLATAWAPAATFLDLARAQLDLRREPDALASAAAAAQRAPDMAEAWFMVGEIATMLDLKDEARHALRRTIEIDPTNTAAMARLYRVNSATDDERAKLERMLAAPGISAEDAANLNYALASERRRRGDGKAFVAHLLAANAAQRAAYTGPIPDLKAINERLLSIFSKDAFAAAAKARASDPTPIFIIGMPRSGTTLVEQIITGAPGVASAGELKFFRDVLPTEMEAQTGKPYPEAFHTLTAAQMDGLAAPLTRLLGVIGAGAPYVTDKTLDNFQRVGFLLHLFPAAKIVCLRRDPMDVCFSLLQQQFSPTIVQTFDLELMAQACRRFKDIMAHWRSLFGGAFIEVQYETLVSNPEQEARRLIEFCGFAWDDALLSFHARSGAVRTFSDQQVRKPIYSGSVGAWREFADELAPLRRALAANGVRYAE